MVPVLFFVSPEPAPHMSPDFIAQNPKSTHLSSRIGSSATAFSLNTRAFPTSVSLERMMMALSVLRRGKVARLLSITSWMRAF